MPEFMEVCERAARAGGEVLRSWSGRLAVREKAPADLVTEADLAAQQVVREVLLGAFPDHGFLGEEGGSAEAGIEGYRWVVDPLDGTMNFVHGVPEYAVSIALEQAGHVLVGTVFNPVSGECFRAEAGKGAFLNGRRLQTSGVGVASDALVAASLPPRVRRGSRELEQLINVIEQCQGLRRTGSAALNLCFVAAGRFDAYWATTTHAWDIAAGMLIVHEAGGVMTDLSGRPVDLDRPQFVAAATRSLHTQICELLSHP